MNSWAKLLVERAFADKSPPKSRGRSPLPNVGRRSLGDPAPPPADFATWGDSASHRQWNNSYCRVGACALIRAQGVGNQRHRTNAPPGITPSNRYGVGIHSGHGHRPLARPGHHFSRSGVRIGCVPTPCVSQDATELISRSGARTRTPLRIQDFKSCASASFAIRPIHVVAR